MADKIPEGDFTKSEMWPHLRQGLPDKVDIVEAQMQTLAKYLIKESERREKQHQDVLKIMRGLGTTIRQIGTVVPSEVMTSVEDNDNEAQSTSRRSSTTGRPRQSAEGLLITSEAVQFGQKREGAVKAIDALPEDFMNHVVLASSEYAAPNYSKLMHQVRSKSVREGKLIDKWIDGIDHKMVNGHRKIWDEMDHFTKENLYLRCSRLIAQSTGQAADPDDIPGTPSLPQSARSSMGPPERPSPFTQLSSTNQTSAPPTKKRKSHSLPTEDEDDGQEESVSESSKGGGGGGGSKRSGKAIAKAHDADTAMFDVHKTPTNPFRHGASRSHAIVDPSLPPPTLLFTSNRDDIFGSLPATPLPASASQSPAAAPDVQSLSPTNIMRVGVNAISDRYSSASSASNVSHQIPLRHRRSNLPRPNSFYSQREPRSP